MLLVGSGAQQVTLTALDTAQAVRLHATVSQLGHSPVVTCRDLLAPGAPAPTTPCS